MNAQPSRRCRWLVAAMLTLLLGTLASPLAAQADETEPTKVLLLLDVSGSMNEQLSSGGTKLAAAKRALKQVANALPPGTDVGLRVYGSKISAPKSRNPRACTDTQLVMPLGPLNKPEMYRAVDSFTAKGETPIAHSLEKSVADLGGEGKRVLVLISDGEETCVKDPCPAARKLASSGVNLQFNAIGLAVNNKARKQLQCIAEAGDGSYYDASRAGDLSEALRKIAQRALRPFAMSGTPVHGTEEQESAPELVPGQYVDSYQASGNTRHYRIPRMRGSTVTASIASLVNPFHGQNSESWSLGLTTESGESCDTAAPTASSFRSVIVIAGAVRSRPTETSGSSANSDACQTEPLVLSLQRRSLLNNRKSAPVELLIQTEPPIANLASLPSGLESYDGTGKAVPATKPEGSVLGGTSFTNAGTVKAGSWTDSPTTGETVFYRVRLETGQRLRVTAKMPASTKSWRLAAADAVTPTLMLYSPSRVQLARKDGVLQGNSTQSLTLASPEVRVRNREIGQSPSGTGSVGIDAAWSASVAGDYYVGLQLEPLQSYLSGRVMPVRLNVAVEGEASGQPQYAEEPATQSAPPQSAGPISSASQEQQPKSSQDRESVAGASPAVGLLVLIAGGVALAVGGVFTTRWLISRRSAGGHG
jgi:Ca-activated chloride channel family protein